MSDSRLVLHPEVIAALAGPSGPAVGVLRARAVAVQAAAASRAPRSAHGSHGRSRGYLASKIVIREGLDRGGAFEVDVVTTARTPKGFPYGSLEEIRDPYLLPGARRANRELRKSHTNTERVRLRSRRKRKRS